MKTVYLVDDHLMFIEGLSNILEATKEYKVIGWATNAKDCLQHIQTLNPDLILCDINMPEMNGIALCKALKSMPLKSCIVVISMTENLIIIEQLKQLKVNGFLPKNAGINQVVNCLKMVLSNNKSFYCQKQEPSENVVLNANHLTKREHEVLKLACTGQSSQSISEILCISIFTVETHRKNIGQKIGSTKIADWIQLMQRSI
jgi:two-component system nitrate/nitrite response regulator NarL